MGTITRSFANNITTSGILLPASLNNNSISNVTAYNVAIATGNMVLISSQTASNSASISFTTGIDSTYKEYQFYFINIKPATSGTNFTFNGSTDSGSNYNVTKTSSAFRAYHNEGDSYTGLNYSGAGLSQSTSFQVICDGMEALSDSNGGGYLSIFNPSSTTYVKNYMSSFNIIEPTPECNIMHVGGYMNTTSAINAIQFKFSSGNISDGTILMYGIK
jgi:hypothetical protein